MESHKIIQDVRVINIGIESFADTLTELGGPVTHVDWRPPAGGDERVMGLLTRLQQASDRIDDANRRALELINGADPVLVDILPAGEAIQALEGGTLLHAGPPIPWDEMCEPMKGAVVGAIRYERWVDSEAEAGAMVDRGDVKLMPNHDFGAVGPMTGITSPSMPVLVVENRTQGNRAYCTINEGIGKVMRFGANDNEVIDRLRWIGDVLAPALRQVIRSVDGVELRPILARALSMGDEMHQRNVAATSLLFRELAPGLAKANTAGLDEVLGFLAQNDQFFLNLAMAAGKATLDPVGDIADSTIVSAMSRNGRDFGIRVGGAGGQWFSAPALMPQGLYFPGYTAADANPDMGDSAIIETMGLGGFAMGGAPAVVGFVGAGTFQDAVNYTLEMDEITEGRHGHFVMPTMDSRGVPCGIDVRKVVETGIAPVINTGIAHRLAGVGQVGAGIVRAPMECFTQAIEALTERIASPSESEQN